MTVSSTVKELYTTLKTLTKNNEHAQARKLIRQSRQEIEPIWQALLSYTISKHNCPVTKIVLKECGKFVDRTQIVEFLEELDPKVEQDFAFKLRVIKFTEDAKDFQEALEKYHRTREAYHKVCEKNFGKKLNRKPFP